jgi:hypothetical protein
VRTLHDTSSTDESRRPALFNDSGCHVAFAARIKQEPGRREERAEGDFVSCEDSLRSFFHSLVLLLALPAKEA